MVHVVGAFLLDADVRHLEEGTENSTCLFSQNEYFLLYCTTIERCEYIEYQILTFMHTEQVQ